MIIKQNVRKRLLYNRYKLLALNMFQWEGLPPTVQPRHIERALYEEGMCLFFEHKDNGIICLPCKYSNNVNVYGEGTSYIVSGFGYSAVKNKLDNVELGLNNDLGENTRQYVNSYAERMAEVEFSIDLNIRKQRLPWIVETTSNNKYSMQKAMKDIMEGEEIVYANKDLGLNNSNAIILATPFIALELNEYKYELEREILTFFGLNNTVEKAERLIVDEVNSNNDFIEQNVEIMYRNRKDLCERINKRFGWNVSVKKTSEIVSRETLVEESGKDNAQ